MPRPIEILQLHAYDGPNIYGPRPGVLMWASCDRDRARRVRDALKDGAQFIGLVIAFLEVEARPAGDGFLLRAGFSTDAPSIGAALCAYVAEGVTAEAAGDEEWDRDGPLFELQGRRRREALPVAALQALAEARRRDLPARRLPDGRLLLGQGARGWLLDPAGLERGQPVLPPWERIGRIPLAVATGSTARAAALARCARELEARGERPHLLDGAGYDAALALLSDPAVGAAAIGLDTADTLRRGLAFDHCDLAAIADRAGPRPPEAADDEEWLRALGLPMLICPAPALVSLADPRLAPLIPHAPYGVVGL